MFDEPKYGWDLNNKYFKKNHNLKKIWYEVIKKFSEMSKSNFIKIPKSGYKWNLFCFPL